MQEFFLQNPECLYKKCGYADLRVGGIQPCTLLDYPNYLSAVIFCQGCPWSCRYCYNPHLQPFMNTQYEWRKVLSFLATRRGRLEAVVFSGGEPLLQPDLIHAIHEVKRLGFKVALHSGGFSPYHFALVLPYVDWVGLDVKALPKNYSKITGVPQSGFCAWECVKLLLKSGVSYECRTTIHSLLHTEQEIEVIARRLHQMGVRNYVIQHFQEKGSIDKELIQKRADFILNEQLVEELNTLFNNFTIR